MADYILHLEQATQQKAQHLRRLFSDQRCPEEEDLFRLFRGGQHWHPLPSTRCHLPNVWAVDGGLQTLDLSNGATLVIAQALLLSGEWEDCAADVEVLPGRIAKTIAERFAELFREHLEIGLAAKHIRDLEEGMLLLDGALLGGFPLMYPPDSEELATLSVQLSQAYRFVLNQCGPQRWVVSVAKSSRATLLCELLQEEAGIPEAERLTMSDSEMIYRWTEQTAGLSTPVLVGTRAFRSGSGQALRRAGAGIGELPAVLSFFVRPENWAPAFRIDVPCPCLSLGHKIQDLDARLADCREIETVVAALLAEYAGPTVYNTLLFAADREVRLSADRFLELYLPLVQAVLGTKLDASFSAGRFL